MLARRLSTTKPVNPDSCRQWWERGWLGVAQGNRYNRWKPDSVRGSLRGRHPYRAGNDVAVSCSFLDLELRHRVLDYSELW